MAIWVALRNFFYDVWNRLCFVILEIRMVQLVSFHISLDIYFRSFCGHVISANINTREFKYTVKNILSLILSRKSSFSLSKLGGRIIHFV